MALLIAQHGKPPGKSAVAVLNLAEALAMIRVIDVAQDSDQPYAQARPGLKLIRLAPRSQQGLLDEVVRRDPDPDREAANGRRFEISATS
jgi:hypothetical protein